MHEATLPTQAASPKGLAYPLDTLRRSLFWRIHFWAALIASPFALLATLTGLLYVFTPQIEHHLYSHMEQVQPAEKRMTLDEVVSAAQAAAPANWTLHSVTPAYDAVDAVQVHFVPPTDAPAAKQVKEKIDHSHSHDGGHNHGADSGTAKSGQNDTSTQQSMRKVQKSARPSGRPGIGIPAKASTVYVNPYNGAVLGSLLYQDRFSNWAKKLHSRLLQSDNWRWMIELAASWMMVMLLTGVYLWWPRGSQKALPERGARGRLAWKQWHSFLGVALALISLVILSTGLTWSKYAGEQIRTVRNLSGQAPPPVPSDLKSAAIAGAKPLSWQAAYEALRRNAPDVALQIAPPKGADGVWRASSVDNSQPMKRFDLFIDNYSGQKLYFAGWESQTAFSKATAIGIPFHRAEFGWWNQLILFIFGVGVLFSLVSGWVMFFKRRASSGVNLPKLLPGAWRAISWPAGISAVVLAVLMPLFALSGIVVVLIEFCFAWAARAHTAPSSATH